MTSDLFLEKTNGAGSLLEAIFICWAIVFLVRDARRRHLAAEQWFSLPPHLAFMMAVVIHDGGSLIRSMVVWFWRRYYNEGDPFNPHLTFFLEIGGVLLLVGSLCKIRAVTRPDYGHVPWVLCMCLVWLFFVLI